MTHHSYKPGFPLHQFISSFTYYKGYTVTHSIDRYLPNGNIEIIINLTGTPKYIYDNHTLTETQACKKIWISGIRNEFISIPSGNGAEMFIIEFKKGMVYQFLGRPLTEITNQVIEGDLVLDPVFMQLREQLLACLSIPLMFITAESLLANRFKNKLAVNPFVDFAVNNMVLNPGVVTIKTIADKTGYSSKHFIKIFTDNVGLNPKAFLRIIRFQKAINEIEVKGDINWISLSQECGYYDQAHFITNFKEFSGFTPYEYMKRKGNLSNYIPVG